MNDLGIQADEAPYRVVESEQRTATNLELWLHPLAAGLRYRPGEYLLLEDSGRGIAPRSYSIANARRSLTLVVSARTEADVIDRKRFTGWQASHPHFRYLRTLTRAKGPGLYWRIPAVLPSVCGEVVHHEAFIAAAPGFVIACAAAVEAAGLGLAHIHTEPFFADPG